MTLRIQLYTFPPSQNAVRTEIALLEKGLEFEKIPVDLVKGEHRSGPLAELTPRQQVPTLVYDDGGDELIVYESIATIRFIDEMHPEPPLAEYIERCKKRPSVETSGWLETFGSFIREREPVRVLAD